MTPPQAPKPVRKRLRPWQILLILAVLIGAGVYLYITLSPTASPYGTITSGTLGARYTGDALIVRDETPYDAEGISSISYVCAEGATVTRNELICEVYSSGYSTKEATTLQNYRDQIKEYETTLTSSETTYDAKMARLDSDALDRAKEFRQMLAGQRGNLSNQEKLLSAAIDARQVYLQNKYATDQRLSRLLDEEANQQQRINSWTKEYRATSDTLVSFYSDGYEYGLTVENYADFTPAQVRSMISGNRPELNALQKGKTTIYRTVRDGTWYVLMLVKDPDWNPVEGQSYELKLQQFENTQVYATVLSFTRQGGELLVRLRVDGSVLPVLYLRSCTAELGDYVQSLCVPSRAIYVQDNVTGVVVVDGGNKIFIPVNILLQQGDETYIESIQQGYLSQGMTVLLF